MLSFEWNALRPGDHVAVHDDADGELTLLEGEVLLVQPEPGRDNDVGVRIERAGGHSTVVRPRRRAVHLLPAESHEACWRCDAIARRLATAAAGVPGR